jgi:hypothetical protein
MVLSQKPRLQPQVDYTGPHGVGQKADDRQSIPLCRRCHEEYGHIGRRNFETLHDLDIEALIVNLNQKPVVVIMGFRYVATLAGEEYDLGSIRKPVASAVKQAVLIARSRVPF